MNDELKAACVSSLRIPYYERGELMSDKDRQKKDGERKDKDNKQTRESENEVVQTASAPQQARDASNLTDQQPGARSTRETEKEGR